MFPQWNDQDFNANSTKAVLDKFDAITLIQRPKLAAQTQLIDDGSGELKVYRIDFEDITEIPKRFGTVLYSGNCYIIHYQLMTTGGNLSAGNTIKNLIYLWSGRQCTQADRTTGELFLAEMFEHFNKHVLQIRVTEGFEPPHFLQLFKGKLIVFNGKSASVDPSGSGKKYPHSFILKVIGNSSYNAKAVQVSNKTIYTPKDCYVLKADTDIWVWCSQYSNGDTREMAKLIATIVGEFNLVMETHETEEFYSSVGEKCIKQLKKSAMSGVVPEPLLDATWDKSRVALYLASYVQENILLEPILAFQQKDLSPENIYLLDVGNMIYVWTGQMSSNESKQAVWSMATQLLSTHPVHRDIHLSVAVLKQGYEPNTFVGFFETWDPKYFEVWSHFSESQ